MVDGQASKFSFAALSVTFGAGLAYLGVASLITDIVLERFLPQSRKYMRAKIEVIRTGNTKTSRTTSSDEQPQQNAGEVPTGDAGATENVNTDTANTDAATTTGITVNTDTKPNPNPNPNPNSDTNANTNLSSLLSAQMDENHTVQDSPKEDEELLLDGVAPARMVQKTVQIE
ncbi:histone acetyltransferase Spt10 [Reticulomyxa filosa]|uniref:Histone acetyltransferase Spt10 n=1 Tax=Reticulomyxa filosa TaxID=46433 RepID=X6MU12_RETFI|nr:histone acetyltransferase Spt10 [Reticulomyxa filosa]|eukprot:ETO16907.1 histone acetyltransferase Spt10 [Reticulomyxa filosa]